MAPCIDMGRQLGGPACLDRGAHREVAAARRPKQRSRGAASGQFPSNDGSRVYQGQVVRRTPRGLGEHPGLGTALDALPIVVVVVVVVVIVIVIVTVMLKVIIRVIIFIVVIVSVIVLLSQHIIVARCRTTGAHVA